MSNRSTAQRSGSARKTEPKDQAHVSKGKEKGLWNFLTWSFFLSQVVAAEQAAAASAQAAAGADDTGAHGGAPADASLGAPLAPVDFAPAAAQEGAPGAATQPLNVVIGNLAVGPPVPAGPAPQAEHAAPDADTTPGNAAAGVGSLQPQVVASAEMAAPSGHEQAAGPAIGPGGDIGHVIDTLPGLPGVDPGVGPGIGDQVHATLPGIEQVLTPVVNEVVAPVVQTVGDVVQVVEHVVAPVLGVVGDVLHTVEPVVEQLVAPVVGIAGDVVQLVEHAVAPVLGLVGDVVGDVLHAVEPVVEQLVAPVVGIAGDVVQIVEPLLSQVVAPLANELVQTIEPVVEHVLAPVTALVGDIAQTALPAVEGLVSPVLGIAGDLGLGLGPVLGLGGEESGPAGAVVAPVVSALPGDLLGSLLGPAASAADQITAATPVSAGSGSLDFVAASPAAALGLNELFSGGSYTDYGLALHSGTSGGAGTVGSGSPLTAALDEHLTITATDDDHQSGSGHGLHLGLPSALEELHLRGLGDGISI